VKPKEKPQVTVVRRIKRARHAPHAGAWKIAYADFVTAMMAFFLLMWLLGSATQGDLEGVAEYFRTPLRIALSGGSSSGESSSIVRAGGTDITRRAGQADRSDEPRLRTTRLKSAEAEVERAELAKLKVLKGKLESAFDRNPIVRQYRSQMLLDITSEGLRVQLLDAKNRPMFENGSAVVLPHMHEILHEIGRSLNGVPNGIALSGHTDAKPYSSGERGYSNWELSADRANASRRELVAAGMAEDKIVRVVGLSSSVLLDRSDPENPMNRRISIVIMTAKAQEAVTRDGTPADAPPGR
jgi:chemotaxis protein MotB